MAFRGLAEYADGQPFEPKVNYIYGRGVRAGFVPVSPTKVYWFICFNRPDPGPKITDPAALKSEELELVRGWPSDLLAVMRSTPEGTVWDNAAVCAARDGVVIPRLVRLGPFLEHTNFECDLLEPALQSP
ncbi:unnamed protein product [Miscanthus lutarioriparius]|uniref:Zeaxanthin epoxidase n=1 Tax=Miscanthus lutarioriparius TaxID=422564 RepID=A0A811SFL9_9POAL|nr:unnamed protein product [Miscanthus lutarioriparius]